MIVLASGSKGNATYIETEHSKILIDSGLSLKELEVRLSLIGVSPAELDGVVVTHEHADHIKSVGMLSRKYEVDVFAHGDIWESLIQRTGFIPLKNQKMITDDIFAINDMDIVPYSLPHDAIHCLGYSVYNKDNKVSFATDLGHITNDIMSNIIRSDLVILESNHDPDMLRRAQKYPETTKRRILSNHGHLSNEASAEALRVLLHQNVRGVILAHLSEETNSPELAMSVAERILAEEKAERGKDIHIGIAPQRHVGSMYKLKSKKTN